MDIRWQRRSDRKHLLDARQFIRLGTTRRSESRVAEKRRLGLPKILPENAHLRGLETELRNGPNDICSAHQTFRMESHAQVHEGLRTRHRIEQIGSTEKQSGEDRSMGYSVFEDCRKEY